MKATAASTKSSASSSSSTKRPPVFRGTPKPHCNHYPCCFKYHQQNQKQQQQHLSASASATSSPLLSKSSTNNSSGVWQGPCGVSTVFFQRLPPVDQLQNQDSQTLKDLQKTGGIGIARNLNDLLLVKDSTKERNNQPNVTASSSTSSSSFGLLFFVGFDINRGKSSVCSGTLADSWSKDLGCAILGSMREAEEEFKFKFKDEEEFLKLSERLWWWESNTVVSAIDLDLLDDSDQQEQQRGNFEYLKQQVAAAAQNKSLPLCQREIRTLSPFVILSPVVDSLIAKNENNVNPDDGSFKTNLMKNHLFSTREIIKKISNAANMTDFGLCCIGKACQKIAVETIRAKSTKQKEKENKLLDVQKKVAEQEKVAEKKDDDEIIKEVV